MPARPRTADRTTPASLRYGSDQQRGFRRRGARRFHYVDERTGQPPSRADLQRIKSLAIPPAWTDVWIASSPRSHVQATGRDARGRKQYRYHHLFTAHRSENKFADLVGFATHLGALRRRVRRDLRSHDLGHDRVIAVIVRLLDLTSLRIGNDEYARANRTYGLTTLHNRHVTVRGSTIQLTFRGKIAREFDVSVDDPTLARIVRRCQNLPGQALFEYRTADGATRTVNSTDVNRYLADHGYRLATAKTFRTWSATVEAAAGLVSVAAAEEQPSQHSLTGVIDSVAHSLGNTRTICRNSYVHPAVIEAYVEHRLTRVWSRPVGTRPTGISADERRTLRLIRSSSTSDRSLPSGRAGYERH